MGGMNGKTDETGAIKKSQAIQSKEVLEKYCLKHEEK